MSQKPETIDDVLGAVGERAEKATKGPWKLLQHRIAGLCYGIESEDTIVFGEDGFDATLADGEFIAAARTDIPALLRVIEKLRDRLRKQTTQLASVETNSQSDMHEFVSEYSNRDDAELLKAFKGET